jgi:pyrimidine deaminase RibD-like protein
MRAKEFTTENFADGRHPEDKGDSKRYHIPTKASVSTLRKVAHQGGRKGQLAHWMANMKAGKQKHEAVGDHDTDDSSITLDPNRGDYEIRNYHKLDKYLAELCKLVEQGQASNKDFGMVGAGILSLKYPYMARLNRPGSQGKRIHAEHAVLEDFIAKHGEIPEGTVLLTTLSPCTKHLEERDGPSCSSLVEQYGIKKVYCGYMDPTQVDDTRDYNIIETSNEDIRSKCKEFADTFLDDVEEGMLPSDTFAGSSVGQKAGVPGQLRGNAQQRKDGKQPAFNKLVGRS